jgi:hypothetical protein
MIFQASKWNIRREVVFVQIFKKKAFRTAKSGRLFSYMRKFSAKTNRGIFR